MAPIINAKIIALTCAAAAGNPARFDLDPRGAEQANVRVSAKAAFTLPDAAQYALAANPP